MAEIFEEERRKTTFNPEELQRFFYFNSNEYRNNINEGLKEFSTNPKLVLSPNYFSLSRYE